MARLHGMMLAAASCAASIGWAGSSPAQDQQAPGVAALPAVAPTSDQPAAQPGTPSIQPSLGPYGDPGGIRAALGERGITYSFTYIGETLDNLRGGTLRGGIYEGRLDTQLDVDLDKAVGWSGATVHANTYHIHGHGLSRYYLANLAVVSGIEALSSTRLYELWIEQKALDGKVTLRAGQLAADTEFLVSQYAGLFVNSTFGWPAITAADLPNGGPAYPLATPGLRLKYAPDDQTAFLLGVFNGAPAGRGPGDPQINNRNGLNLRLDDPAFLIGEASLGYGASSGPTLPGAVKFGAWHQFGRTNSQRLANDGTLLADPAGSGVARRLTGNDGVYAVLDQQLYREAADRDQGLGIFARVAASPGDRNLVGFYADAGLTYKGLLPGRPDDTVGLSGAFIRVSDGARAFDADAALFGAGTVRPVRSSEALIEATYQAQIVPGWTLQPDLQYIWRPGGHVADPRSPAGAIERNALVVGLRTAIRY